MINRPPSALEHIYAISPGPVEENYPNKIELLDVDILYPLTIQSKDILTKVFAVTRVKNIISEVARTRKNLKRPRYFNLNLSTMCSMQ